MAKVKVYAKAMNRTALGIVNAYFKINPKATYQQLKEAFPDSLYEEVEGGFFNTIKPLGVFQKKEIVEGLPAQNLQQCHFMKEDEVLTTGDGIQIYVTSSWGKAALDRLAEQAKKHDIIVAESQDGESFKRGEFRLEILQPLTPPPPPPPPPVEKNNTMMYVGIAIGVLALAAIAYFMMPKKVEIPAEPEVKQEVVEPEVEEEVIVFNNIYFETNDSKIKSESEEELQKALAYFTNNPNLKVKIVGHTDKNVNSNTEYNNKLSLDRATSVMNWLVSKGVNPDKLDVDGKGYSKPVADNESEDGRAKNRRIEFVVLAK